MQRYCQYCCVAAVIVLEERWTICGIISCLLVCVQVHEVKARISCNSIGNSVAAARAEEAAMRPRSHGETVSLYAPTGGRKYLNREERGRVLAAMRLLPPDRALFALTLAWTGARVSEVLALTPASFQIGRGVVALVTLKRRRHVVREVPIPPGLMRALDRHFDLAAAQRDPGRAHRRLWPMHRATAWRTIKQVMMLAELIGPAACPRGLRHSFCVAVLQAAVPLNLAQRWMGHARISTTAIYADVSGPEEMDFARSFWRIAVRNPRSSIVGRSRNIGPWGTRHSSDRLITVP
jgi:integrase